MLVIPAIDLREGKCIRLSQGLIGSAICYDNDPVSVAQSFVEQGARMLHVVDLDAAFGHNNDANRKALNRILHSLDVPIQFGGGIRTATEVQRLCDSGVTRVVLGTVAAESLDFLKSIISQFGERICVAIDARDGRVFVRGWQTTTQILALELARRVAKAGARRIIYTDILRDGMLTGPNVEQTLAIARESNLKVTASGGISSLLDLQRLKNTNEPLLDSVIVGKALYERKFSLPDALRVCASQPTYEHENLCT